MTTDDLLSIIRTYASAADTRRILVVSSRAPEEFGGPELADGYTIDWRSDVRRADDLGAASRSGLGIVFDQVHRMMPEEAVFLLSRLRDCYCDRVVVAEPQLDIGDRRLLSLGYVRQEPAAAGRRVYLYDPESFFERREWNTPENWAHPEAFDKRRW